MSNIHITRVCAVMMPMLTLLLENTLSSGSACLLSLHSLASLQSVAKGHIIAEALLIGQQCQAETIHALIPCSIQSKTLHAAGHGLLLVLHFVVVLVFAFSLQQDLRINLLVILVGTGMLI